MRDRRGCHSKKTIGGRRIKDLKRIEEIDGLLEENVKLLQQRWAKAMETFLGFFRGDGGKIFALFLLRCMIKASCSPSDKIQKSPKKD
jgi:hypothetical protein